MVRISSGSSRWHKLGCPPSCKHLRLLYICSQVNPLFWQEFKVTADSDPANEVTFRKLLLVRCQKEFERSNDDDEELVVKSKALKEAGSDTKSRLQEEYDSFLSKARRRKLGNIR